MRLQDLDEDPLVQFERWLKEAAAQAGEHGALAAGTLPMRLAAADGSGRPSARTVLLEQVDGRGLVFFTNLNNRKGEELRANPRAALVIYWASLGRQVVGGGRAKQGTDREADAYFTTRPRDSQLAAWASPQSRPIDGREELDRRFAEAAAAYGDSRVPRPSHWSGFRVVPDEFEFWEAQPSRLHDRIRDRLSHEEPAASHGAWLRERLGP